MMDWADIRIESRSLIGPKFVESIHAVEMKEDWSGCRSIPRAMRRMKQGHMQRMKVVAKPCAFLVGNDMFIHPTLLKEIRHQTATRIQFEADRIFRSAFYGV